MTKTFTYDDVVKYLYAETTENENALIVEAMSLDNDLLNFYLDTLEIKGQMNKVVCMPSGRSVERIFEYARQHSEEVSTFTH